ncbi:MAG TPA: leucine-rich repeat domain-containing protein [Candidatus Angelobacter sp.]|nr:leucine-rich repeat domain-containing protein [Candidatus Angelobacter sp.]
MQTQSAVLRALTLVAAIFVSSLPQPLQAQFACTTNNGTIAITGYSGPGGDVSIPDSLGGLPVTSIADAAFQGDTNLSVVTIPNSVTNIGARAFEGCIWLLGVNLPTNFPSIGNLTFNQCFQLVGINLPNTITNIGDAAFGSCSSLREITIPDSVKNIGNSAFNDCWRLGRVAIGNGTEYIGPFAFAKCVVLTNLLIGSGVTNIDQYAFESCSSLPMVIFPPRLEFLGYNAFAYCSGLRAEYFLGNAVTNLQPDSFSLPDTSGPVYYLPGTVGWESTYQYHPTILWNPRIEMNRGTFGASSNSFGFRITGTTNLSLVVEASTNLFAPVWRPIATNILGNGAADFSDPDSAHLQSRFYRLAAALPGDYAFSVTNGTVTLTRYYGVGSDLVIPSVLGGLPVTGIGPNGLLEHPDIVTLSIPESVTNIGQLAFEALPDLKSVTIAAGVIGPAAFAGSPSLTNVVLGNGVRIIGADAFADCPGLTHIEISSSVTNIASDTLYSAFSGCTNLTNITVDAGNPVYASADGVLFDRTLTALLIVPQGRQGSYTVPESVTQIGSAAFAYCRFTNVSFPPSLRDIGDNAFLDCLGLTNIVIPDAVTNIGSNAFAWDFINSVAFGNGLVVIGNGAFMGCKLTDAIIPDSVTKIDGSAFADCYSLSNLTLGLNVSDIGPGAFAGCAFTSVMVPATVTNLDPEAFPSYLQTINVDPSNAVYSSLDGVVFNSDKTELLIFPTARQGDYEIPEGTLKIGNSAFADSSVTNVTMPASLVEIGTNAFQSSRLASATIPDGVKCIDETAFANSAARSVTIGNGVTNIEDAAFISAAITNVIVGSNVTYLGMDAFGYCFALQTAYFNGNAPSTGGYTFDDDQPALKIYYRQGTSGWGQYFDGRATTLWIP